jgi:hypothetical protein
MKVIVSTQYGHDEWRIHQIARKTLSRLSRRFGMSICEFVTRFSTHQLPGQVWERELDSAPTPPGFSVDIGQNRQIGDRLRRAARADRVSVNQFAWSAIANWIDAAEEPMILDPKSGEVIGSKIDIEPYRHRTLRKSLCT